MGGAEGVSCARSVHAATPVWGLCVAVGTRGALEEEEGGVSAAGLLIWGRAMGAVSRGCALCYELGVQGWVCRGGH